MRFDARSLIEKYKGFIWAEGVRVDRVCICKMGVKKIWSGGIEGEGEVVDEQYEVVCEKEIFW
jgi:activating signal cointegrator complex subunit 1